MGTYFDFDFYAPGDSVAGLDTVIQDAATALNDIPLEAMQDGSLNRHHFASGTHIVSNVLGGSLSAYTLVHSGSDHVYTEGSESIDYSAYGTDSTADRCVVGDTSDAGYTGVNAEITGLDIAFNSSTQGDIRVWAKANVQVSNAGADVESVMICLQVGDKNSGGSVTWRTVDRTERFVSRADHQIATEPMTFDVPIKTMLSVSDLSASLNKLDGVRVMVSATGAVTGTATTVTLNRWNLTVLPVRFGAG